MSVELQTPEYLLNEYESLLGRSLSEIESARLDEIVDQLNEFVNRCDQDSEMLARSADFLERLRKAWGQ